MKLIGSHFILVVLIVSGCFGGRRFDNCPENNTLLFSRVILQSKQVEHEISDFMSQIPKVSIRCMYIYLPVVIARRNEKTISFFEQYSLSRFTIPSFTCGISQTQLHAQRMALRYEAHLRVLTNHLLVFDPTRRQFNIPRDPAAHRRLVAHSGGGSGEVLRGQCCHITSRRA